MSAVGEIPADRMPEALKDWPSKSRSLWYRGDLDLLNGPMVSIVGTRNPSTEGIARTQRLTRSAVEAGWVVVSGLAMGVDAVAHQTTLDLGGRTIAVLGTSIDLCYPKEHKDLKTRIEQHGLVLSQFPVGTNVSRGSFPTRNTLMAALSALTLVVEAGEQSGTRHQVRSAIKMNRLVGCLRSLADTPHPWIKEVLSSDCGRVIATDDDLISVLVEARDRMAHGARFSSQGELF